MSITTEIIRFFTLDKLVAANTFAVQNELHRSIQPERLKTLSKETVYPISMTIPTSYEMDSDFLRCRVILSDKVITHEVEGAVYEDSDGAWIDIPFDFYMNETLSAQV